MIDGTINTDGILRWRWRHSFILNLVIQITVSKVTIVRVGFQTRLSPLAI